MPRDSNGNYTLPSGNPVVTGTTIASSWANTTLSDIGNEITDSLDRSGKGGMLAAFKLTDGTVGAPAFAFQNEPSTGLYRVGAGQMAISILGTQVGMWTANGLQTSAVIVNGSLGSSGTSGLYQPGTNELGFFTNGIEAGYFDASQNLNLVNPLAVTQGGTGGNSAAAGRTGLGIPAWSSTPVASDLVQYDASAYIHAAYFQQSSGESENPTIGQVFVENNAADGYLRKASISYFYQQCMASNVTVEADPGSGYPTSGNPYQMWCYY